MLEAVGGRELIERLRRRAGGRLPLARVRRLAPDPPLKALLFDVFGTCVDWRTSVAREAEALGLPGERVADAWRARYQPQLETVRSGEREWVVLDVLHREALDDVLDELGLELGRTERDALTLAWHRLDPGPTPSPGLARLKERYVIAPCSNGHIAQSVTSPATPACRGTRSSAPRSPARTSPTRASTSRASRRSASSRPR